MSAFVLWFLACFDGGVMRTLVGIALTALLLTGASTAQTVKPSTQIPNGSEKSGYISVMSKAGTPTPRPQVPNRQVAPPKGAQAGYDYYYGYRWRGGGGSASPSYANESAPPTSTSLPGYDTKPRFSKDR